MTASWPSRTRATVPSVDNPHTSSENERDCAWEDRLSTKPALPIHDMEQRHVGLTKPIADSYAEAAGVCLDRHHQSPTDFNLHRNGSNSATVVQWPRPDARTRDAWANGIDTTEAGASPARLRLSNWPTVSSPFADQVGSVANSYTVTADGSDFEPTAGVGCRTSRGWLKPNLRPTSGEERWTGSHSF